MVSRPISLPIRYYRQYPPVKHLGTAELIEEIRPDRAVFLIIDVYGTGYDEEALDPDMPEPYRSNVQRNRDIVVNRIRPARDAARAAGFPIVYLTNFLKSDTGTHTEWRNHSISTKGVDVLELWKEPNEILQFSRVIAPEEGDPVVKKQHYSGFFETNLEEELRKQNAFHLIAVGFDLRLCLTMTLTDALYRNFRPILLRDCTSTMTYPTQEATEAAYQTGIQFFESNVGYTSTSQAFIEACR